MEQSQAGSQQQQGRECWGWLGLQGPGTHFSPTSLPRPPHPSPNAAPHSVLLLPASGSVWTKVSHGVRCSPPLFPDGWEMALLWPPGSRTGTSSLLMVMMMPVTTLVHPLKLTLQEREGPGV